jgi:S-formylglutathione hydrolase FrmB
MTEVIKGVLPSRTLDRDIAYRAIVPGGGGKRSAIYLLHGLFGNCDNFIDLTRVVEYAETCGLAVITPDGGDSWYVQSAADDHEKFESFFFNEFISAAENKFPLKRNRRSRGIAGISMGGYAALKLAVRRPEMFAFAASSSGAFHAPLLSPDNTGPGWDEMQDSIMHAFGPAGSETRRSNDLFRMVDEFADDIVKLPAIFLDCGKDDSFLKVNRSFADELLHKNIPHTYDKASGGHDWDYWDKSVAGILNRASGLLK